ncbi:hypothetical protein [Corallococcus exercitus]|uniref:hypothetical protein n=1 Tax=Corallococcus exercitus TaxID=2316736 RepID=UPI0035D4AE3D
MTSRGRVQQQIAEALGTTPRNIRRFLTRYLASGLKGLRIQWAPGCMPLNPEGLAPTTLGWVQQGPFVRMLHASSRSSSS